MMMMMMMMMMRMSALSLSFVLGVVVTKFSPFQLLFHCVNALPLSQPYIAYRTDPYNQTSGGGSGSSSGSSSSSTNIGTGFMNVVHSDKPNHPKWWQQQYDIEYQQQQLQQQQQQQQPYRFLYNQYDHRPQSKDCPLELTIGTSQRIHTSTGSSDSDSSNSNTKVQQSPLIVPSSSSSSSSHSLSLNTKQILLTTNYEQLDLYVSRRSSQGSTGSSTKSFSNNHPSIKRNTNDPKTTKTKKKKNSNKNYILQQDVNYPILLESSSMVHLSPIYSDINMDGNMDVIVTDYDGSITVLEMMTSTITNHHRPRYYHHTQVPRLYIRREWMEHYTNNKIHEPTKAQNETDTSSNTTGSTNTTSTETTSKGSAVLPYDPFHSYFEYYYSSHNDPKEKDLIRGQSVNILQQDRTTFETIQNHRRNQQQQQNGRNAMTKRRLQEEKVSHNGNTMDASIVVVSSTTPFVPTHHRRLEEVLGGGASDTNRDTDTNGGSGSSSTDDDVGIPELNMGDDDAAIIRDMDDQQRHRYDHDHDSNEDLQQHQKGREETIEDDQVLAGMQGVQLEEEQRPPRNDDPVLAGIRRKQEELTNEYTQEEEGHHEQQHTTVGISADHQLPGEDVDQMPHGVGDDMANDHYMDYEGSHHMMDDYAMYGRHDMGDDRYGSHDREYNDYYDAKQYIRLPPHILTTPTLVEIPKLYTNDRYEKEDMLFVAVSYYFDEDEFDGLLSTYQRFYNTDVGDETEARRGSYVANAIMMYVIGSDSTTSTTSAQRWMGQTHLDLSSDYTAPENITVVGNIPVHAETTQMSALALSTPTVVDLDGDGKPEVILGTNMGLIYVFDARQMLLQRDYWPIQLLHPIEHQILVEDVSGTTDLEMFVSDIGGTIACLNHRADVLWQHNALLFLPLNTELNTVPTATSPITLGDVNGDGFVDIVQIIRSQRRSFVVAFTASTGDMLLHYPIELDGDLLLDNESEDIHHKLTQALLVDLHTDQSFLNDYLHRKGGTKFTQPPKASTSKDVKGIAHGGVGAGLHLVMPHGENIFIVEGSTGCTQKVVIGTEISAMVQVDDVHGTDQLDLVIVTENGNVMALETSVPFHPLNTWTGGSVRNHRSTSHVHGYSASQGIYVHDITRQYTDIFGVYVPITFEIFDTRPNIQKEPDRRRYLVEVRDGPSWKRALWRNEYNSTGVYTERVYIRYGPGYYTLYVTMQTSHGIIYEDTFSVGYNIHFLDGLDVYLWLPLLIAAILIFIFGASKQPNWNNIHDIDNSNIDDDDGNRIRTEYYDNGREGHSLGILGRAQLPT